MNKEVRSLIYNIITIISKHKILTRTELEKLDEIIDSMIKTTRVTKEIIEDINDKLDVFYFMGNIDVSLIDGTFIMRSNDNNLLLLITKDKFMFRYSYLGLVSFNSVIIDLTGKNAIQTEVSQKGNFANMKCFDLRTKEEYCNVGGNTDRLLYHLGLR